MSVLIKKASGDEVIFKPEKLRHSLFKAGAKEEIIDEITKEIEAELQPGMSTNKIYQRAFTLLKRKTRPAAARYKLKRAIGELGPSGFPFEKYVGEIIKQRGFEIEVGKYIQGKCITHEVDVLGDDGNYRIAVECKFGNKPGKKLDVKVPLYIQSRFLDLSAKWKLEEEHKDKKHEGWIVTNAEFTEDAQHFGMCAGLHLISWSFPAKGNLKQLIDASQLYPVTSLTSLTKAEKKQILSENTVLVMDLLHDRKRLEELRVPKARLKKAMAEIEELCGVC